jgi:hypothetical protein
MREREALRVARAFVAREYPAYAGCYVEVALEEDGERSKSWSFGVHVDEEDIDYESGDPGPVGYVHSGGHVEGLYGVNR